MEKVIQGCVYCERTDVELALCCRRHARLVCPGCRETRSFTIEHELVAQAS